MHCAQLTTIIMNISAKSSNRVLRTLDVQFSIDIQHIFFIYIDLTLMLCTLILLRVHKETPVNSSVG